MVGTDCNPSRGGDRSKAGRHADEWNRFHGNSRGDLKLQLLSLSLSLSVKSRSVFEYGRSDYRRRRRALVVASCYPRVDIQLYYNSVHVPRGRPA
jgi:hypothetical protein